MHPKKSLLQSRQGFTLIELLIVMAILGILSTVGLSNFQTTKLKARDAKRKNDLQTIAKGLEAYANDYQAYPDGTNGHISCCDWGTAFIDPNVSTTIYIAKLPKDDLYPKQTYQYIPTGAQAYTLYAHLENENDPAIQTFSEEVSCGEPICNYKITSSNLSP